jgi:LTXXQ motif family protein
MWNVVLGAAVAAAIAGSSQVHAQQQPSAGERGPYPNSAQQDRTDPTNVGDTLASLKQRLRLSPEQEKNWSAFESAYRGLSDYRRERMKVRQEQGLPSDPAERMRQRAESLTGMGAALARLADAEAPLYGSLSDDQKRQFAALSPGLAFRSEMQRRRNDDDYTHRDGRGSAGSYDRDDRARRHRDEDDRAGWRGRDERDGRGWREGDDYDRPGWRGGGESDRRDWREGDDYDRPRWGGRDEKDSRGRRDRDDYDRPGWRGQDERDRRGWRDRDDYDRPGWRGRDERDSRGWRDRDDYGPGWRGRDERDRRGWRDRDDYDHPGRRGRGAFSD